MAIPRFLVDRLEEQGTVMLAESESHHAARVLRMEVGQACVVFDGQGYEAAGVIETVDKKSVRVAYPLRTFAPRDHQDRLHFAIAMPKGDRQRNVIEKLVELGVDRLTPIETDRSVSKFDDDAIDRLRRHVVEASKQSQRNRLMQIDSCSGWKDWLSSAASRPECSLWVLHPRLLLETEHSGVRVVQRDEFLSSQPTSGANGSAIHRWVFAVGPEGGFTKQEISQAVEAGLSILDLGDRILRVETAVSVAATLGSIASNAMYQLAKGRPQ
jgi:16S rRNA (uracil1498-N3)-methyltransferase